MNDDTYKQAYHNLLARIPLTPSGDCTERNWRLRVLPRKITLPSTYGSALYLDWTHVGLMWQGRYWSLWWDKKSRSLRSYKMTNYWRANGIPLPRS